MAVFHFVPNFGASKVIKPRISKASFGDGYEQRTSKGINTTTETWSLNFSARSREEAFEIESFFKSAGGYQAFGWTPPNELIQKKYICEEWNVQIEKGDSVSISAVFKQVHE